MKRGLKAAATLLLVAFLLLSPVGHVQGKITVTADISNNKVNFVNDNLTFYFWYGPPQALVYINPTFAWLDNNQPSILYVVDMMGLFQFNSTQTDKAFQRNETVQKGAFSWIGNEAWSSNNKTITQRGVTFNYLNLTLHTITNLPHASNFTYLQDSLTLGPTNYGTSSSSQKFYNYNYAVGQSRTDVFFNMTQWKWTTNTTISNLALMFGFYALNVTVIQKLGIHLEDYVVPDYNFISPEDLKLRYAPLDPTAFPLTGMNLTASNGATTPGGFFSLTKNETAPYPSVYEHQLNYALPSVSSTSDLPFIKLQFASGNTTLPGYFSFPGFAIGLDSKGNKKDTLNVTSSYISTGNYARLFLSYPYFSTDQLRHFFSFGVDDRYLPPPSTLAGVYIVLPSLPYQQALLIGGVAVVSIVGAVFATRMARKESLGTK